MAEIVVGSDSSSSTASGSGGPSPTIAVGSDSSPEDTKQVYVVSGNGTFGTVDSINLAKYLEANPGARLADTKLIAQKEFEAAEARRELADPWAYQRELYHRRNEEIDRADNELGMAGKIAGGLFALSPLGMPQMASQIASAAQPGNQLRNPLPALARTQASIFDPGGLTSAGIGAIGGEDTKAFLDRQHHAPGYAEGQVLGMAGAAAALPAAGAARLGAEALGFGVEGAVSTATDAYLGNREISAQKILLGGAIGAGTALVGAGVGKALEGTAGMIERFGARNGAKYAAEVSEAASKHAEAEAKAEAKYAAEVEAHAKRTNAATEKIAAEKASYEEKIFNKLSKTDQTIDTALEKVGQSWSGMVKENPSLRNANYNAEDIAHNIKILDDVVSKESSVVANELRARAEFYRDVGAPTDKLGADVRVVLEDIKNYHSNRVQAEMAKLREVVATNDADAIKAQEFRVKAAEAKGKYAYEDAQAGSAKFLSDVDKVANEYGAVEPGKLDGLRKSLDSGKYRNADERRAAKAVYERLRNNVSDEFMRIDPTNNQKLWAAQQRLNNAQAIREVLRDINPVEIPPFKPKTQLPGEFQSKTKFPGEFVPPERVMESPGQVFKDTIMGHDGNVGNFSTAFALTGLLGGHVHGAVALGTRATLKSAFAAMRNAVPDAVAGAEIAAQIRAVDNQVSMTAKSIYTGLSRPDGGKGSNLPKTPSRAEYDAAIERLKTLASGGNPEVVKALSRVDGQLGQAVSSRLTVMAQNAMSVVGSQLASKTSTNHQDGSLAGLFKAPSYSKELQPSELTAWDYVSTLLKPMETLKRMEKHRVSHNAVQALLDNYPDVMAQLQDEIIGELSSGYSKHVTLDLQSQAYLSKILGRPVSLATDPKFAAALKPTATGPAPAGGGPDMTPQPMSGTTNGNGNQTESERIEG